MGVKHNGAPDRFILCSGGLDSTALAAWAHGQFEDEQKTPVVVYLDTTIGLSAQRIYVQMLCDHFGWYVTFCRTPENFDEITLKHGFYGQSREAHNDIFEKLKGRWISKFTTISGNPHFYWGVYKDESEKRKKIVTDEFTGPRGATHHAPFADWTYEEIVQYAKDADVPANVNWDGSYCTDCCCGSGGANREELIDLEAEGYVVMANKIRELQEEVETGDRKEVWAWGSFTESSRKKLDAAADDVQNKLAEWGCGEHCSAPAIDEL